MKESLCVRETLRSHSVPGDVRAETVSYKLGFVNVASRSSEMRIWAELVIIVENCQSLTTGLIVPTRRRTFVNTTCMILMRIDIDGYECS